MKETAGKDQSTINVLPAGDRITYNDLLEEGKNSYNNLQKSWGPAKAAKENPVTAMVAKITKLDNKLNQALKQTNGGGNNQQGNGTGNGKALIVA